MRYDISNIANSEAKTSKLLIWKLVNRAMFGHLKQILLDLKNFCKFAHL
jgi:hypothetical protein